MRRDRTYALGLALASLNEGLQLFLTVARLRIADGDRLEQVVGVPHFSSPGGSHGPILVGSQGINREVLGHKKQNPSRINDLGFFVEPDGTSRDAL